MTEAPYVILRNFPSRCRGLYGFRLAAVLLGCGLFAILAELGLRLAGLGYGSTPFEPHPILHHVNPPQYRFLSYSPKGEFGGFPVEFDAEGCRVLSDSPAGPASERLAVLGDSFAAGLEVPAGESLAGLLAAWGKGHTEVKSYGVPGYSPILEALQWNWLVKPFRPTAVLLMLYSNDIPDDHGFARLGKRDDQGIITAVPYPALNFYRFIRWSYLIRFVRKEINLLQARRRVSGDKVAYEDNQIWDQSTLTALQTLRKSVEATGARFLVTAVPSKLKLSGLVPAQTPEFADRAQAWASAQRVAYLDLTEPFAKAAKQEELFYEQDIHWNAAGNRVAAEAVARFWPDLFPGQPEDSLRGKP